MFDCLKGSEHFRIGIGAFNIEMVCIGILINKESSRGCIDFFCWDLSILQWELFVRVEDLNIEV